MGSICYFLHDAPLPYKVHLTVLDLEQKKFIHTDKVDVKITFTLKQLIRKLCLFLKMLTLCIINYYIL